MDSGPTSSDDELLANDNPPMVFMDNISASQDPADKRFMRALQIANRTDMEHAIKKGQLQVTMDQEDNDNGTDRIAGHDEDSAYINLKPSQSPKGGSPDGTPRSGTNTRTQLFSGNATKVKIEPIYEWPRYAEYTDIAKGPFGEKGRMSLNFLCFKA